MAGDKKYALKHLVTLGHPADRLKSYEAVVAATASIFVVHQFSQ